MVHVTNAWTVQILTTVSNAKTHQARLTLVTDLKYSKSVKTATDHGIIQHVYEAAERSFHSL